MGDERLKITAYERMGVVDLALFRAPPRRGWMDRSAGQFAYRCLPVVIANQTGWLVRNPIEFTAVWTGGPAGSDIRISVPAGQAGFAAHPAESCVESHFGGGVLTFVVPYLFRTSAGYNLWVKGPVNCFKDGIQAIEGMVETDWAHAPFTMNWKFTRAHHPVRFQAGEPICQIIPYPRGLVERFDPEVRSIDDAPELAAAYRRWHAERGSFLQDLTIPGSDAWRRSWQKDYFQGRRPAGERFPEHQTHLPAKDFVRVPPGEEPRREGPVDPHPARAQRTDE